MTEKQLRKKIKTAEGIEERCKVAQRQPARWVAHLLAQVRKGAKS